MSTWRSFFLTGLVLVGALAFFPRASAGTLDLAVVQLAGLVDEATVNAALEGQNLAEATLGDRFEVRDRALRGSPVLYAQTLTANLGQSFLSSTRLGGQRAEVEGHLDATRIQAQVALSEGVQAPLRRFSRLVYRGQGTLLTGPARVLSLRQIDARNPSVVRGQARVSTTQMTIALLYQFRR